jgi:hypothetical protein
MKYNQLPILDAILFEQLHHRGLRIIFHHGNDRDPKSCHCDQIGFQWVVVGAVVLGVNRPLLWIEDDRLNILFAELCKCKTTNLIYLRAIAFLDP